MHGKSFVTLPSGVGFAPEDLCCWSPDLLGQHYSGWSRDGERVDGLMLLFRNERSLFIWGEDVEGFQHWLEYTRTKTVEY